MKNKAIDILRLGLSVTFLWIGYMIYKNPEMWGSQISDWAIELLPISLKTVMLSTAALDILIGIFLIINRFTWIAATIASIHLLVVLVTVGITSVTVRDIGLLSATSAIAIHYYSLKK